MTTTSQPQPRPVEMDDVQGLARFGHHHMKQASFLLLRVTDRDAARHWLATAPVTNAEKVEPRPQRSLQVALTSEGLRALGVSEEIVQGFSTEFVSGMAGDDNRSRRLGDVEASDPRHWNWGAPQNAPHVLVMLYAEPGLLDDWQRELQAGCKAGFEQLACLSTSAMDDREPFGFLDGISQPQIDWERRREARDQERQDYTNLACLGEFLLGYPNEYGGYTDRPLLEVGSHTTTALPRAEDAADKADLGRNGSYLVFRQLQQDVHGFWQFLDQRAEGDAELRRRWAEAMVGRTLDGKPLVNPTGDLNAFDYRLDAQGLRCPLGAHVRRANPRNADLPDGKPGFVNWLRRTLGFDAQARERDLVASTRFHRLIRRGRAYGHRPSLEQALAGSIDERDTGLHFICLNGNIARQFEFVQSAWLVGTRFDGLNREGDPLLGARAPERDGAATDAFSMPQTLGADQRLCGLPRFVSVRGGAYFFLPGIRALRYLATVA